MSPLFTSETLTGLFERMLQVSESLKNYMREKFEDDSIVKTINFKDIFARLSTDVTSSLAYGIRTNSFQDPPPEFYRRSRIPFTPGLRRTLDLFVLFFYPNLAKYVRGSFLGDQTDYFRQIFWDSMKTREEENIERGDAIDLLIKLKNDKSNKEFQGDKLVAQSITFFIASVETSSTAMSFTLWELAKNPEIQKRLRQHIIENLDEKTHVTYASVLKMKYLMSVINETLRHYPSSTMLDRMVTEDYKIPGTDIVLEKGTVVYIPLTGLHMDPKYFIDPEIYDPDRFSEERKKDIKPFTYMPFGEGPRSCMGYRIGMLLIAIGLISILPDYELSPNPKYTNRVSPLSSFTLPENGMYLDIRRIRPVT